MPNAARSSLQIATVVFDGNETDNDIRLTRTHVSHMEIYHLMVPDPRAEPITINTWPGAGFTKD